jgi:hypothetical protein
MVPIEESLKPIFHKIPRKTTYVILIDWICGTGEMLPPYFIVRNRTTETIIEKGFKIKKEFVTQKNIKPYNTDEILLIFFEIILSHFWKNSRWKPFRKSKGIIINR